MSAIAVHTNVETSWVGLANAGYAGVNHPAAVIDEVIEEQPAPRGRTKGRRKPASAAALAMRDRVGELAAGWRAAGHELGFGVGVAQGPATLGTIGFEGRLDYAAIGTVVNLAARLSDLAKAGQVLVSKDVVDELGETVEVEPLGPLPVKGLARAVQVHDVRRLLGDGDSPLGS